MEEVVIISDEWNPLFVRHYMYSVKVVIHDNLFWLDYMSPEEGAEKFEKYRRPIADFTSLVKSGICVFNTGLLAKYADYLDLENHYILDYRSYIPYIVDYKKLYFPFEHKLLTVNVYGFEDNITRSQMRHLIIQKLINLSRHDLTLAKEITDFYLDTVESAMRILGMIYSEPHDTDHLKEIKKTIKGLKKLQKKFMKSQISLKHVKLEFTQVDVETEEERSNAAAKCRQLEILGLDEILKSAFKKADNPAASIANFLLSFRSIKPVTLMTQLNGTISNYSGSNSNARNVSQNFKEKDFDYLHSIGIDRSIISKYKNRYNL